MLLSKLDALIRESGVIPPLTLDIRTLVWLADKAEGREARKAKT